MTEGYFLCLDGSQESEELFLNSVNNRAFVHDADAFIFAGTFYHVPTDYFLSANFLVEVDFSGVFHGTRTYVTPFHIFGAMDESLK